MKHNFLIILFLLCFSWKSEAQPYIDIVSIRNYVMPAASKYSDAEENTNWFTAGLDLPIKLKENYLLLSPFFERYTTNTYENLYGAAFPVTFLKQWKNQSWKTAFTFIPRYSFSEFASSDIFQPGGAVLAIYKKKENLKYKFGAYYNSEFFGFFMIPLLGIDWNINAKWNLFGVLPGSLNLEYKLLKHLYTGMAFRSITNSFRAFKEDEYFKIQDNHLRLFADFYLTKHLVVTAEAGHSILREYSFGYKSDGNKTETDLEFPDGFVYKASVSWRIRLDEN
jgi:hypothetical protein